MIHAVALVKDEHKIITPLEALEDIQIEYIVVDESFQLSQPYPDIILTVSDWRADIARVLLEAKRLRIPTLLFQDGTLDWIIQYEGEKYGGSGGATHFHPILTDKIAVIGHQSARLIASWNDKSRVEVVGFPILQEEIENVKKNISKNNIIKNGTYTVLITSTRQGWFCERQKSAFVEALSDLKAYFNTQDNVKVIWRLARNLAKLVNVENEMSLKESKELVPLINDADIVISAQSTVVVEAMLHHKPVAIIDYLNAPQFYGTSWLINTKEQIQPTVESMLRGENNRMLFQDYQLQDILYMSSCSIKRAGMLIKEMVKFRKEHGHTLYPENLLSFNEPFQSLQATHRIEEVYPEIEKYFQPSKEDLVHLVSRYSNENRLLKQDIKAKSFLALILKLSKKIFRK